VDGAENEVDENNDNDEEEDDDDDEDDEDDDEDDEDDDEDDEDDADSDRRLAMQQETSSRSSSVDAACKATMGPRGERGTGVVRR